MNKADRFVLLRSLAKLHLRARDKILRRIILEWIIYIAKAEALRDAELLKLSQSSIADEVHRERSRRVLGE
jgi:hypothetical protein